jgi:two-component system NtrC family sensor kinase
MIVGPVTVLTRHAVAIRKHADLSQRINPRTTDELGMLGREFDQMVGDLATARNRLAEQSFHSGEAEMAAGTLHHIRNALTPLVGEVDVIRQETSRIPVDDLERALGELSGDAVTADRRDALTRFVCTTADTVAPFVRGMIKQADSLSMSIQQIEEMLGQWDETSHTDRVIESVPVSLVVSEAASAVSGESRSGITIKVGDLSQLPNVQAERHTLLQILTAVIRRAVTSIRSAAGNDPGQIEVNGAVETIDGTLYCRLTITDNGAGLTEQMIRHAFDRNSVASDPGDNKYNLHWCANKLTTWDGRMWVASTGAGLGSVVRIDIPATVETVGNGAAQTRRGTGAR